MPLTWDEIKGGFEECYHCRAAQEHTPEQHVESTNLARARESRRQESLARYARLVYETDRL